MPDYAIKKEKNTTSRLSRTTESQSLSLQIPTTLSRKFSKTNIVTLQMKRQRDKKSRSKETRLTYQAAPKTETPTESAMPIAENTKGDM